VLFSAASANTINGAGSCSSRTPHLKLTTALEFVREGDVLVVTKPDRLARSTRNLLDIVEDLEKRGSPLVVLSMGGRRIDTRSPTGKLMLTNATGADAF
jgi:DNA invertase Pin-like site-specific DNA recombinase